MLKLEFENLIVLGVQIEDLFVEGNLFIFIFEPVHADFHAGIIPVLLRERFSFVVVREGGEGSGEVGLFFSKGGGGDSVLTRTGAASHADSLFDLVNVRVVEFEPRETDNDFGVAKG